MKLGEHLKEIAAWSRSDHLSGRHSPRERIFRPLRREWDLQKTRRVEAADPSALIEAHRIDLGIDASPIPWAQNRGRRSGREHIVEFARELKQAWLLP